MIVARSSAKDLTTTVIYVGGESRSGSTVLSTILGSYGDLVSIGEFRTVWLALKTRELCGCGEPISFCGFWTAVGDVAFEGWDAVDVDAMLRTDRRMARHRAMLRHIVVRSRRNRSELELYRETLGRLYRAIQEVSGASVIVDSTKDPSYAYLLREIPGVDLRVLTLVRDSRGVAYSCSKEYIIRPELARDSDADPVYMPTWPMWRTAVSWDLKNLLFYLLIRTSKRRLVKYEDFVARPRDELSAIRDFAGVEQMDCPSWNDEMRSFELLPHHTLGGNPVRFGRGHVRLESDNEWRLKMSRNEKILVTTITLPLLLGYRYIRFSRRA
jgi:hypothetical protein